MLPVGQQILRSGLSAQLSSFHSHDILCFSTVPPPGLQGIRWNNLGAFVYVIFDAPTDRAITAMGGLRRGVPNRPDNFDCDVLLQFSTFTVYQLGLGTLLFFFTIPPGGWLIPSFRANRLLLLLGER